MGYVAYTLVSGQKLVLCSGKDAETVKEWGARIINSMNANGIDHELRAHLLRYLRVISREQFDAWLYGAE